MTEFRDIRVDKPEPHIARISLARPKQMNAYTTRLCEEMVRALDAYLRGRAGYAFCAHCLAREMGAKAADVREAMWTLEPQAIFHIRTAQCVSCLLTKPVIRYEDVAAEGDAPRRIIEFLLKSVGLAFCSSCIAFCRLFSRLST